METKILEYYTINRFSGKVIGPGHDTLDNAITAMAALTRDQPDVVVIKSESCEIVAVPRSIGDA